MDICMDMCMDMCMNMCMDMFTGMRMDLACLRLGYSPRKPDGNGRVRGLGRVDDGVGKQHPCRVLGARRPPLRASRVTARSGRAQFFKKNLDA